MRFTVSNLCEGDDLIPETVQTLRRAITLLDLFSSMCPRWTSSELAAASGIHKATVHRVVTTLEQTNVLTRVDGAYELHPRLIGWVDAVANKASLNGLVDIYLDRIAAETNETVVLFLAVGRNRVAVKERVSSQPVRRVVEKYTPLPLYCGAAGKAILSAYTESALKEYLAAVPLEAMTDSTITNTRKLREAIGRVRQLGYATSQRERISEGAGVAVVIKKPGGGPLGALGIALPAHRFDAKTATAWGELLITSASEIHASLSHRSAEITIEELAQ